MPLARGSSALTSVLFFHGFCVTSFRTSFDDFTFLILVGGIGRRGGIKMASASTQTANEPAKDLILVHTVQLKPIHFSRRMVSSGTSNVAITSVHSEKTRLKKLIMIIIIMKKLQDTTVFSGCQKLTSAMKLRPEK